MTEQWLAGLANQRDKVHDIVTRSVERGATLAAGGGYDGLFYQPTVLAGVPGCGRSPRCRRRPAGDQAGADQQRYAWVESGTGVQVDGW